MSCSQAAARFADRGWPLTDYALYAAADRYGVKLATMIRGWWSEDQEELLRVALRNRMTPASVAKLLSAGPRPNTTENAVRGKAYKLGISVAGCNVSSAPPTETPSIKPPSKPVAAPAVKPQPRNQRKEAFPNQCATPRCQNTRAIPYLECVPCRDKIRLAKKEEKTHAIS